MTNTAQKFGLLTVLGPAEVKGKMRCRCDCGNEKLARMSHLKCGSVKSCGCLLKTTPRLVHGRTLASKTLVYKVWDSMVNRCTNPNAQAFHGYGGRGISVCAEWLGPGGYFQFVKDMGPRPDGGSLDRIDNNAGYSPENCRWATHREQCNNKRSNTLLEVDGRSMTVSEWSVASGIRKTTIFERIKRGWDAKRAVTEPARLLSC
jgi:hypothetical protein